MLKKETIEYLEDSQIVCEAIVCANDYYAGDRDPLYVLMCHVFEEWDESDLEAVSCAVDRMATMVQDNGDEEWYDTSFSFSRAFETALTMERGE